MRRSVPNARGSRAGAAGHPSRTLPSMLHQTIIGESLRIGIPEVGFSRDTRVVDRISKRDRSGIAENESCQ